MRAALLLIATSLGCGGGGSRPAGAPAAAGAPCFPDREVLIATEVYKALQNYLPRLDEGEVTPSGTFGTCTVSDGAIRTADGVLVGELGCGLRILVPKIKDELGLELGALGADVLARKAVPVPALRCLPNGPDQVRCTFERGEDDQNDATAYVVAGTLVDTGLIGEPATRFFATRRIVEIDHSAWCH